MPIYEFECKSCGKVNEFLVRTMSGKEKLECPDCGGTKLEKKFSTFATGSSESQSPPPNCQGCQGAPSCPMARG